MINSYTLTAQELDMICCSQALYAKGFKESLQADFLTNRFHASMIGEDTGNVLIFKRRFTMVSTVEATFSGDGCYLGCLYTKNATRAYRHSVIKTRELSDEQPGKFSLFSGFFGRNGEGKLILPEGINFEVIQLVIKRPLIKEMAQIDGVHAKLFEQEYRQSCEHAILAKNIYSPSAVLILEQMLSTRYEGQLRSRYIELKAIELFIHLMHVAAYGEETQEHSKTIAERAMLFIEHNYQNRLSDEMLAQHLQVSKTTLRQKFQEHYGISIQSVIRNLRMAEVEKLLQNGCTFSEIAEKLRYKNQTDLKRAYAKWTTDD